MAVDLSYHDAPWQREIGAMLAAARRRRKMTQQQLADIIGTHVSYINKVETGKLDIRITTLGRILSALAMQLTIEPPSITPPDDQQ